MATPDLAQIARDVEYLKDRRAIEEVVHRHARGHDRFDVNLMTAACHPDATDEHGAAAVNRGPDYAQWANAVHAGGSQPCLHKPPTIAISLAMPRMPKAMFWSAFSTPTARRCD